VILSFRGKGTEDIFNGVDSKVARKTCPRELWGIAGRKLDKVQAAVELRDLKEPPGNRLQPLKGDRAGQRSIRINDQYRICFNWEDGDAANVEITDYHD
jgi:proteic killer suppression protein